MKSPFTEVVKGFVLRISLEKVVFFIKKLSVSVIKIQLLLKKALFDKKKLL